MILINLLPPEMRKKQGNANPLVYAIAAAYLVAALPLAGWAWVKYSRIPHANEQKEAADADLAAKTAEAQKVEELESQIAEFEAHRSQVLGLLARKMYWAKPIDEFVNHLNGPSGQPWRGFEVSCTELTIVPPARGGAPAGARAKDEVVQAGFRGKYKIVGMERDKGGDYIRDFFIGTEGSRYWSQMGFVGKPEASYRGDTPDWKPGIDRLAVELTIDWTRAKRIASGDTAKPVDPAGQGM